MTKKLKSFWTPIYYAHGNLFVLPVSSAFVARTEADAKIIGELTSTSVQRLTGAQFTGEALHVTGPQRYVKAKIGGLNVAVLSGPAFTHAVAKSAA